MSQHLKAETNEVKIYGPLPNDRPMIMPIDWGEVLRGPALCFNPMAASNVQNMIEGNRFYSNANRNNTNEIEVKATVAIAYEDQHKADRSKIKTQKVVIVSLGIAVLALIIKSTVDSIKK